MIYAKICSFCSRANNVVAPARPPVRFFSAEAPVVDLYLGQLDQVRLKTQTPDVSLTLCHESGVSHIRNFKICMVNYESLSLIVINYRITATFSLQVERLRSVAEVSLIFFYAPWCAHSMAARQEVQQVAKKLAKQVQNT